MLDGITKKETHHGNPGEKRILPAGLKVRLIPATNLPPNSEIKFWAYPMPKRGDAGLTPWPEDTRQWAEDVGVGLRADDVEIEFESDSMRRRHEFEQGLR